MAFTAFFVIELIFKLVVLGHFEFFTTYEGLSKEAITNLHQEDQQSLVYNIDSSALLDFVVVVSSVTEILLQTAANLNSLKIVKILRLFRVLRFGRVSRAWAPFQKIVKLLIRYHSHLTSSTNTN